MEKIEIKDNKEIIPIPFNAEIKIGAKKIQVERTTLLSLIIYQPGKEPETVNMTLGWHDYEINKRKSIENRYIKAIKEISLINTLEVEQLRLLIREISKIGIKLKTSYKTNGKELIEELIGKIKKVERFRPKIDSDPVRYRIYVNGDENKSFEVFSDEINTAKKFKQRWFEIYTTLPRISGKDWPNLIDTIMKNVQDGKEDDISTEQAIVDEIIAIIQNCDITSDRELCWNGNRLLYVEFIPEEDNTPCVLYFPSKNLMALPVIIKNKIDLRRIRQLLDKYISDTKTMRVSCGTRRFWAFKSEKMEINVKEKIIKDDEEENGEDVGEEKKSNKKIKNMKVVF